MSDTLYPTAPVLLVDDEETWLRNFSLMLRSAGVTNILACQDAAGVMEILNTREVSTVALDLNMPGISGEELIASVLREFPDLKVIVITGINQVEVAVRCIKLGAFEYLVKSTEADRLISGVRRAVELKELATENRRLKEQLLGNQLSNPEAFSGIITRNNRMFGLLQYVEAIAPTGQPVLITGESGVGKELVARAVHDLSKRPGLFVAVNLAGVDESVFSDTLFGHRKGAYTGADEPRTGLVERAANGTLFLDEIGDLTTACQVKLLRLCQEREYSPLGSDIPRKSTARLVIATNQDLAAMMTAGRFRKDLFYRLNAHTIRIPPLRERKDDIPVLTEHLLEKAANALGKKKPTAPPQLYTLLRTYSFPGNVRELEGMIFDAVSRHTERMLALDTFRERIQAAEGVRGPDAEGDLETEGVWSGLPDPLPTLKEMDRLMVAEALRRAEGNQAIAAQMLGITRQALNQRVKHERKPVRKPVQPFLLSLIP
jgi:DNA-binding NtrC family response regulator